MINPEHILGLTHERTTGNIDLYSEEIYLESNSILVAIAAYVTSYARIELYRLLDGSDPAYCDTDSIVTRTPLAVSSALGALKLEAEIDELWCLLPKLYAYSGNHGDVVRSKGFPSGTFSLSMIRDAVQSGDKSGLRWEAERLLGIFEGLVREQKFAVTGIKKRRVISSYDKRLVDGYKTEPLFINSI